MEVYKTQVTVDVGFSVQTPSGDWEKSGVSISTEVGPGYPTAEEMAQVAHVQMTDAVAACNEQINSIADKTLKAAQR